MLLNSEQQIDTVRKKDIRSNQKCTEILKCCQLFNKTHNNINTILYLLEINLPFWCHGSIWLDTNHAVIPCSTIYALLSYSKSPITSPLVKEAAILFYQTSSHFHLLYWSKTDSSPDAPSVDYNNFQFCISIFINIHILIFS